MADTADKPARVATMSRAIMYATDPDSEETRVTFNSAYRLCDDSSYFEIKGVGEGTHIRVDHIMFVIEALQEVARLNAEVRS